MMLDHGKIGRHYSGQVTQIITGSIGFDDWEWGVDLFADDPLVFKKLIYEMRFDEASAWYAEFGPFYVGLQFSPSELPKYLEGRVPALVHVARDKAWAIVSAADRLRRYPWPRPRLGCSASLAAVVLLARSSGAAATRAARRRPGPRPTAGACAAGTPVSGHPGPHGAARRVGPAEPARPAVGPERRRAALRGRAGRPDPRREERPAPGRRVPGHRLAHLERRRAGPARPRLPPAVRDQPPLLRQLHEPGRGHAHRGVPRELGRRRRPGERAGAARRSPSRSRTTTAAGSPSTTPAGC